MRYLLLHHPSPILPLIGAIALLSGAVTASCAPAATRSSASEPPGATAKPAVQAPAAPQVLVDCLDCPRMVVLAGGAFVIGSPPSEPKRHRNEGPQRALQLPAFAIAEAEVTVAQFGRFLADTGHAMDGGCLTEGEVLDGKAKLDPRASWRDPTFPQTAEHPVVCVSWQDAADYAAWLSRTTGRDYRLPSEAEWEYAARAGTTSAYFWGDERDLGCGHANGADQSLRRVMPATWPAIYAACDDGALFTAPVRHYRPNAFGLFDMIGNAWEWVADCYVPSYDSLAADGAPRMAEDCRERIDRGGSWNDDPEDLRAASGHHIPPETREYNLGFRVARRVP